jgi:hypothetical protein
MRRQDKRENIEKANKRLEESYLTSKGLLKEDEDLKWIEDALNEPNMDDLDDDSWDLNIGDRIVFVPITKGYDYDRCVGVVKNVEEHYYPVEDSLEDDFNTEVTINNIKCTPESNMYPNNELKFILEGDEWIDDHNIYKI